MRVGIRAAAIVAALAASAASAGAQWQPRITTPADVALAERVMRAEDARAPSAADLAMLVEGMLSRNPDIRVLAVRAIGRLRRDLDGAIAPALGDDVPAVRRAAAHAIAQGASANATPSAGATLMSRLAVETDPSVRGAIVEALGRLPRPALGTPDSSLERIARGGMGGAVVEVRGRFRGLYFAARRARGSAAPFRALLLEGAQFGRGRGGAAADSALEIRTLSVAAMIDGGIADTALVRVAMADPSDLVRVRALGALAALDSAGRIALLERAAADPSPKVRFVAIGQLAARARPADACPRLRSAARDADGGVALAAIGAMARCPDAASVALLDTLAATDARPTTLRSDHVRAHALVSLAAVGPERARRHVGPLSRHTNPFVRIRAATAARTLRDTAALFRLAEDSVPNVMAAAVAGLSAVVGHAADAVYLAALRSTDSNLLMAATAALRASTDGNVRSALLGSLDRVTALRRETSRDGRVALLDRIQELGRPVDSVRIRPYLADFDPAVAERAATVLAQWSGTRPPTLPRALAPAAVPTIRELDALARTRAVIDMADGGRIELVLHAYDAPTNVARFARLARAGYFDGLTFHRVVPNFVIQGGSPAANEYAGDGPFTRDELGLPNRRGTVGISTRGHDTGDGQIYVNLIDNIRLDPDYTVFAEIAAGMDVVDRILEGAVIRRITLRGP